MLIILKDGQQLLFLVINYLPKKYCDRIYFYEFKKHWNNKMIACLAIKKIAKHNHVDILK